MAVAQVSRLWRSQTSCSDFTGQRFLAFSQLCTYGNLQLHWAATSEGAGTERGPQADLSARGQAATADRLTLPSWTPHSGPRSSGSWATGPGADAEACRRVDAQGTASESDAQEAERLGEAARKLT